MCFLCSRVCVLNMWRAEDNFMKLTLSTFMWVLGIKVVSLYPLSHLADHWFFFWSNLSWFPTSHIERMKPWPCGEECSVGVVLFSTQYVGLLQLLEQPKGQLWL